MAAGGAVGTAYIEVSPKMAGNFKSTVERAMPKGTDGGRKFGSGFAGGMKSTVSAGAVAVGNIMADVAMQGAAAAKDLVGGALDGFAQFEQLSGGVEKLFGADAAKTVMANAENAFKTAGMSANQYMEQATSFSAALIKSTGGDTQKAAELADTAMRAMSDNVNTFGTSMGDVQNAFQGFAKQNYTMLDNLKLGYGGTKSEMAQLVKDSGVLGDAAKDLTAKNLDEKVSYGQIVEAIQRVQEKQGIAGTTAKEAATTVEGSVGMMKAAWENWTASLGRDDVDMGAKTQALVESFSTAAQNVIPRLSQVFQTISAQLPGMVASIGPVLVPALSTLVSSLVTMLGGLVTTGLPPLVESLTASATVLVGELVPQIVTMAPMILQAGITMLLGLVQAVAQVAPQVIAALPALISGLLSTLASNLPAVISAALGLFTGLVTGLLQAAPQVIAALIAFIPQLVQVIAASLPQIMAAAGQMFGGIGQALGQVGPMIVDALVYLVTHLPEILVGAVGTMVDAAGQFFGGFVDGIMGKTPEAETAASTAAQSAADAAAQNVDATAAGNAITDGMTASLDFSDLTSTATAGTSTAIAAAATKADGSKIGKNVAKTAGSGLDKDAMSGPAKTMAGNAVKAAQEVNATEVGRNFSAQAASGVNVDAMNSKAATMVRNAAAKLTTTSTVSVKADLSGVNALRSAASGVAASYRSMSSSISASMRQAAASARTAAASIRQSLNIPNKTITVNVAQGSTVLPHFSMSGEFNPKTKQVPTVSVRWWAKGGIFDRPSVIGVGEAGPEAVVPIDRLGELLGDRGGSTVNVTLNVDRRTAGDDALLARKVASRIEAVLAMEG